MSGSPPTDFPEDYRFGPYRLSDRVAVGGMAEVFRAIEPRPVGEDRVICVKRMLPHLASEPGALAMFEEEARLGTLIRHPNVVQMLGFGEADGQPYLALEYVRGCDLWRLLRWVQQQGLGLPIETCLYVVREILKGLSAVHEARDAKGLPLGVVHRDVSPSNVLLSVHGDVKLGDLGIAQSHLQAQSPARHNGRQMGKLGYLAPEQVSGAPLDVRTDLFAVGVITAELLMGGKPLFRGGSELAILLAIRDGNVDHFSATAKSLPEGVHAFVVHLLAASPGARPRSASEALIELETLFSAGYAPETDARARKQFGDLVAHATGEFQRSTGEYPLSLPEDAKTPHVDLLAAGALRRETAFSPKRDPHSEDKRETKIPPPDPEQTGTEVSVDVNRDYAICVGNVWRCGLSYAEVVESIALGQVQASDQLRLPTGETVQLLEVPEFLRHASPGSIATTTYERLPGLEPSIRVAASEGGVVAALGRSILHRETGLWLAEQGAVRKEIYVVDGAPVLVASNMAGELLGEYLVARGVVSRGELDMALAVMPRFEGKLGETLVALGLVEPVHLFQHIAAQVEEKLLETALWSSGHFSFYPGATAPGERFPLASSPWEVLLESTRRRLMHGLDSGDLGDAENARRWVLARTLPQTLATSMLPGPIAMALTLLRQPRFANDLIAALDDPDGRDVARGLRVLTLLARLGICVPVEGG